MSGFKKRGGQVKDEAAPPPPKPLDRMPMPPPNTLYGHELRGIQRRAEDSWLASAMRKLIAQADYWDDDGTSHCIDTWCDFSADEAEVIRHLRSVARESDIGED